MKILLLICLTLLIPTQGFADIPCGYPGKHDACIEFYKSCGEIKGDQILLSDWHKNNIIIEENGLACIIAGDSNAFYINQQDQSRRAVFNDNGCDYFEAGFARGYENGKMVYIDKKLNVKLKPDFELLLPFDYDHAVVCNGPFETIQQGEYTLQRKGKCGLINNQGKLVVEAKHSIEDREVFQDYINSHNHCPKPPITDKKSAICHAKRHLKYNDTHKSQTTIKSAKQNGNLWLVQFTYQEEPENIFVIELDANKAGWLSILPVE
jgi:hypothetical protein